MRRALPVAVSLFSYFLFLSCPASAQNAGDTSDVRAEVAQLRAEVAELKARLQQIENRSVQRLDLPSSPKEDAASQGLEQPPPVSAEAFSTLQSQVSELAQTKVESNSRQPVKIFGTVVSSTQFNSGEANWIDIPNLVLPRTPGQATGSFSSNLRQSRIGVILNGPQIGSFTAT